jgi:23S rRNA (guanosine2251-2'-O)-methyltransferase
MTPRFPRETDSYEIEGLSAVMEYLRHRPQAITCLYHQEALPGSWTQWIKDIPTQSVSKERAQGKNRTVWATVDITSLDETDLYTSVASTAPATILALDHLQDPHNLGAIARSAAFFGVQHILAPDRRQVLLTPASIKTSQGAFALTNLYTVTNLVRTLKKLKEQGYWIVGTDMQGEPIEKVAKQFDKRVLVVGNEGTGLANLVRRTCDVMAKIPTTCAKLDSLNVSVATGIFLYELM